MTDWAASTDITAVVREARALWERGRAASGSKRVEVYVKRARRRRVSRDGVSDLVESGTAVRWAPGGGPTVMHVAIGGTDARQLERAIGRAGPSVGTTSETMAAEDEDVPCERLDLESASLRFEEGFLREALNRRVDFRWIEVGLTVEVLVGPGSWTALRSRARSLTLVGDGSRLIVGRGFELPGEAQDRSVGVGTDPEDGPFVLRPHAASSIVTALVRRFHGTVPDVGAEVGRGWVLTDDPLSLQGIAGGAFDDAGFPTRRVALAREGRILGGLAGRGAFWRRSFRDAPRPLPSTLVVSPAPASMARSAVGAAETCRLFPLGRDEWILEVPSGRPRYLRTSPSWLVRACVGSVGPSEVTAEGVVTPSLVFERLDPG